MSRKNSTLPFWSAVVIVVGVVVGVVIGAAFYSPPPPDGILTEMCVQHSSEIAVHAHVNLAITILNDPYTIPANIGIISSTCYRPLHTHDASGLIHVELQAPRTVYLKDLFAIWGQPFSRNQVLSFAADAGHEIILSVGGIPSGSYENLIMLDGQSILIEYRVV